MKTSKVLRTDDRYDYRKRVNTKQPGAKLERFVETASWRLVVDWLGNAEISPVKNDAACA